MSLPSEQSEEERKKEEQKRKEADQEDEKYPPAVFDIYVYDDVTQTAKMEKFVTIGSFKHVRDTKLLEIRAMLNSEKGLSFRLQGSSFCNKVGAIANESLLFSEYLLSLDRGGTKIEEKKEKKPDKNGYSVKVPRGDEPVTERQVYAVYFKSRSLTSGVNDATREFLKQELGLELRKSEISSIDKPDIIQSAYSHKDFMAAVSDATVVHPTDMTQAHWNSVMEINSLLHGSYVRLPLYGVPKKVERAMYPAFNLRSREFHDFTASLDNTDIIPPTKHLIIPRYRVEDDSYVEVSENNSSVSWAMASSSLSEAAAEVAIGGGCFGFHAGVHAGFKNEETSANSEARTDETKHLTITYNFPRVVLQLDEESLQITDQCAAAIKCVKDKASALSFKAKYGSFFATRVELGGRLHATEDSAAMGKRSTSEKSKALKVAAGLSFSSAYVQASVNGSYGSSSAGNREDSNSSLDVSMTWEAKGGDTLLCNNPPAWCATVASFYNWRVVKQENLLSIEDMISKIPGYENTKEIFEIAMNGEKRDPVIVQGTVAARLLVKDSKRCLNITEPTNFLRTYLQDAWRYSRQGGYSDHWHVDSDVFGKWWKGQVCKAERRLGHFDDSTTRTESNTFSMNGMVANTDGVARVIAGGEYTLSCNKGEHYLQGTTMLAVYEKSFLFAGAKDSTGTSKGMAGIFAESAGIFTVKPVNTLLEAGTSLGPEDEFYLDMRSKTQNFGLISSLDQHGYGVADGTKPLIFTLEYLK